jgi:hypothetical protein
MDFILVTNLFNFCKKFGVEFEVNKSVSRRKLASYIRKLFPRDKIKIRSWETNVDNLEWICKTDASCGYEICSPVMSGFKDLDKIRKVSDFLKLKGVKVNSSCGLHIHIGSKDISTHQLGKILAYWLKSESIIFSAFPSRRTNNHFCKSVRKSSNIILSKNYAPRQLVGACFQHRNQSLNIRAYSSRGAIEFRIMEGTLNSDDITNWIMFCSYFTDYVKNMKMPENLISFSLKEFWKELGLEGTVSEEFRVFSPELNSMRVWLLKRIRKFGRTESVKNQANKIYRNITDYKL